MLIYLAHNFDAREWLRDVVVPYFESYGHTVVSSWIMDDSHIAGMNAEESAVADLQDIEKCDALVHFSEQVGNRPGRGKYVEVGYAIRAGKRVIVVGNDMGCVFYHLPTIRLAKSLEEVLPYLCGRQAKE